MTLNVLLLPLLLEPLLEHAAAAMITPAMQPAAASPRFLNLDELIYEPPRRSGCSGAHRRPTYWTRYAHLSDLGSNYRGYTLNIRLGEVKRSYKYET
jgi:hypothetical protein